MVHRVRVIALESLRIEPEVTDPTGVAVGDPNGDRTEIATIAACANCLDRHSLEVTLQQNLTLLEEPI